MGFTKPYTYVNDTVLSATDHASNEDKLRSYVNQEIEDTDVDTDTIVGESILYKLLTLFLKLYKVYQSYDSHKNIVGSRQPLKATIKSLLR